MDSISGGDDSEDRQQEVAGWLTRPAFWKNKFIVSVKREGTDANFEKVKFVPVVTDQVAANGVPFKLRPAEMHEYDCKNEVKRIQDDKEQKACSPVEPASHGYHLKDSGKILSYFCPKVKFKNPMSFLLLFPTG